MRTAILHCHDDTGNKWTETYQEGDARSTFRAGDDIQSWAVALIDKFNATLRPHERPRALDRVEIRDDGGAPGQLVEHDWHKTNAVTISDRIGVYDAMRCERCGVTGKRFGVTHVKLDSQYKAKAFQTCAGARALFEKRKRNDENG